MTTDKNGLTLKIGDKVEVLHYWDVTVPGWEAAVTGFDPKPDYDKSCTGIFITNHTGSIHPSLIKKIDNQPYDFGPTQWSPDTIKFAILDWRNSDRIIGFACAANAREVRQHPPTLDGFAMVEILTWQKNGAPLKAVAKSVVTKKGWEWRPIHGARKSWGKRDYRNANFR